MFGKVLIANRGEVAVRVIRACREMGVSTVAVYSEADSEALHVHLADESICIGPPPVTDSYLNMTSILSAAVCSGAEAIHPGYGLLSENSKFASLCTTCGIAFIGPPPDVIDAMGDKDNARKTMSKADVPVVPGSNVINDINKAKVAAERIGFPLLIKAKAGGGGRGIRQVEKPEDFKNACETASAEAMAAFSDGGLYLEKLISPARHIEVQIMADKHGNVLCLGERECSLQRRNQKVLEESPSPAINEEQRERLYHIASRAARAVGYQNAGTIEFLMDENGHFYFMEMNTRLQVEHPVTEMVTGIDIVKWQIRVAAGHRLPWKQKDISINGHAMECRINAENPHENYRPSCGKITLLHVPGGPGVRFDSAIYQGYTVPPFYDSMIGKLIVHANTREEAIRKMHSALSELVIEGIEHNLELQLAITRDDEFLLGKYDTSFLTRKKVL
ncbi:MAG: acetyl-CoA carboxylase biotin carboxylase subunit [Bacillota bacterium]|nr:acetyl-CoA carboxylase biotin carboxylase subunit [Bacillota bacterium]